MESWERERDLEVMVLHLEGREDDERDQAREEAAGGGAAQRMLHRAWRDEGSLATL